MGVIFYASSISADNIPRFDVPNIDKFFHLIEYFILGFLLVRAFTYSSTNPKYIFIFIAAVIIGSLYGALDGFHQRFVPGRMCDIFDLLSDFIGSAIGAGLSLYKERVKSAVDKAV